MLKIEDIKPDKENPRKIDEESKKMLSHSIKNFGDISGITFNRKTMELICGHRRFKEIEAAYNNLSVSEEKEEVIEGEKVSYVDILSNNKPIGFKIKIVSWDLEKQKIANVVANTPLAQGQFDSEKLKYVVETYKLQDGFPEYKLEELQAKIDFEEAILKTDDARDQKEGGNQNTESKFLITVECNSYETLNEVLPVVEKACNGYEVKVTT